MKRTLKRIVISSVATVVLTTSIMANEQYFVGMTAFSPTLKLNGDQGRDTNINFKVGKVCDTHRAYIQTGKLYDNKSITYRSTTLNYDFNLAKEDDITVYAGVHLGEDKFELNSKSDTAISKGLQFAFVKDIDKNQDIELGFRYTISNNKIDTSEIKHADIFYIGYNYKFGYRSPKIINNKYNDTKTITEIKKILSKPTSLGIEFKTNSNKIKSSDASKLNTYIDYLKAVPTAKILIEAHTDSIGSDKYNLELSQKRANSVKNKLEEMGVNSNQIEVIGYGETKPLESNDSKDGRQKNRRVTAKIIK